VNRGNIHRVGTFSQAVSLGVCAVILVGSLGYAFHRRARLADLAPPVARDLDPQPQADVASTVPVALDSTPDRLLVRDTESTQRIADLLRENDELRARIERLEAVLVPTTQAQMAVAIGQPEDAVAHTLGRSQVLRDAAMLAETLRALGPARTWEVLQAEIEFYGANNTFRSASGEPVDGTWNERAQWHRNVWVPHMTSSVATFCDRLYRLGTPSLAVESFRKQMQEGF